MDNKDFKYIKNFNKITLKSVCEELNINMYNLLNGRTKDENYKLVREKIDEKYKKINEGVLNDK